MKKGSAFPCPPWKRAVPPNVELSHVPGFPFSFLFLFLLQSRLIFGHVLTGVSCWGFSQLPFMLEIWFTVFMKLFGSRMKTWRGHTQTKSLPADLMLTLMLCQKLCWLSKHGMARLLQCFPPSSAGPSGDLPACRPQRPAIATGRAAPSAELFDLQWDAIFPLSPPSSRVPVWPWKTSVTWDACENSKSPGKEPEDVSEVQSLSLEEEF